MLEKQFEELKLTGTLPSPTGVGLSILQLTQGDDFTIADISRTLQADPTLTGRIIKLANSSTNGGVRAVTTVQDAAVRLGVRTIRNLALGFTLVSGHRTGVCKGFDYDGFWSQSLALAVAAQALAARTGGVVPGEAFTCGLLAHIGRLALASIHPERYAEVIAKARGRDMDGLAALEVEAFGIDHRELAVAMLEDWKLPESFSGAVSCFDCSRASEIAPTPAGERLAKVLRPAFAFSKAMTTEEHATGADFRRVLEGLERARAGLELEVPDFDRLLSSISNELAEWGKLMNIATSRALSYETLQRRATETKHEGSKAADGLDAAPAEARKDVFRILAVDDDPVSLKLLSFHLGRAGYEVLTAQNGKQGLALAMEHMPQIVVTDWSMPEMTGVEMARTLRSSEEGKRLQIILLTGKEEEQRVLEAFEAGVDEYLNKPFNPAILVARVRSGQRVIDLREQVERDGMMLKQKLAENAVLTRRLHAAAYTDSLTELPNRRFAMKHLEQELAKHSANNEPVSVILIDIDKFKVVNDTLGHDVGDLVLRETAAALRRSVRSGDKVCRLGGEEFLVISSRCPMDVAAQLGERLRAAVESNVVQAGGFNKAVTISLGVASSGPPTTTVDTLIKLADMRVYAAKNAGRNRVVSTGGEVPAPSQRRAG